jgi:ubiquinone biosynthesis protein
MSEQIGWRGLIKQVRQEATQWAGLLPQLPRLVHRALSDSPGEALLAELAALRREQARQRRRLTWLVAVAAAELMIMVILLLS